MFIPGPAVPLPSSETMSQPPEHLRGHMTPAQRVRVPMTTERTETGFR